MAFGDKKIEYTIVDDFDHTIDESGNQFIALRKIRWGDREKVSLDLRKYWMQAEGEVLGKGVSFLTEDGPHELANVLVREGFGNTKDILKSLKNREDFQKSLNIVMGKESEFYDEEVGEEEIYDPKSLFDVDDIPGVTVVNF